MEWTFGRILLAGSLALGTAPAMAVSAQSWSLSSAAEFAGGELAGTALDEEGQVRLAQPLETLWGPGEGIVWAVEPAPGEGAFVAASSPGRVLHVTGESEAETWFEAPQESLVAAVAADGAGGVFFGLSPEGQLFHSSGPGQAEMVAETGAVFIWALERSQDGAIWIGTGLPGTLMRYEPEGELETVFETGEDPVRCIATIPGGNVIIGTGGQGRVILIRPDDRPFVLLDADEAEIVSIDRADDGTVYALAAQGSKQIGAARSAAAAATVPTETVRVVATPPPDDNRSPETRAQEAAQTQAKPADPRRFKTAPGGALYRLGTDGSAHRLWRAAKDVPFAMVRTGDGMLLVATGDTGRIFRMDDRGRSNVSIEIPSDQASALAKAPGGAVLIGGTTDARVERLGPGLEESGRYYSPILDAEGPASWGRLNWEVDQPRGSALRFVVRAGNTVKPDETWTDWVDVGPDGASVGADTRLPASRWFQVAVEMRRSKGGASPVLRRLELFFVPHNRGPVISTLTVQPPGVVWMQSAAQSSRPVGPLVADDPIARKTVQALRPKGAGKQVRKTYELGARTISWAAQDPDGDRLAYRLEIRREDAADWLPLADGLDGSFHGWDARGMPDGFYRVRLTAEDTPDNPEGKQRFDQRISSAFRVDNTRPSVSEPEIQGRNGQYRVDFVASDTGGKVVAVEVAVDTGDWQPLDPLDGVADSAEERYRMVIETGEQTVVAPRALRVRVIDASGNLGGDAWALDGE